MQKFILFSLIFIFSFSVKSEVLTHHQVLDLLELNRDSLTNYQVGDEVKYRGVLRKYADESQSKICEFPAVDKRVVLKATQDHYWFLTEFHSFENYNVDTGEFYGGCDPRGIKKHRIIRKENKRKKFDRIIRSLKREPNKFKFEFNHLTNELTVLPERKYVMNLNIPMRYQGQYSFGSESNSLVRSEFGKGEISKIDVATYDLTNVEISPKLLGKEGRESVVIEDFKVEMLID